jgi:hypothetical protein
MKAFLRNYLDNKKAKEIYFFDCIDPTRYWLCAFGVIDSYIYKKNNKINPIRLISLIRALLYIIRKVLFDKKCVGVGVMGYGYNPEYWLSLSDKIGCKIEIVSSLVFEYRYHVIIKKIE